MLTDETISGLGKNGLTTGTFLSYVSRMNSPAPIKLVWDMTSKCNLDCPFCYIKTDSPKKDIPFDKCKTILDEMIDSGLIFASLSGGECLLVKDFCRIYHYLKTRGVLVTVFTNGTTLSKEIFDLWKEYPPASVEISLYDSNTDSLAYKAILRLIEIGVEVVAKCTVTTATKDAFLASKTWCEKNNVRFLFDTELFSGQNGNNPESYLLDYEDRLKLDAQKYAALIQGTKDIDHNERKRCFECDAAKMSVYISPDFDLSLCMDCEYRRSLKTHTFADAFRLLQSDLALAAGQEIIGCYGCEAISSCKLCAVTAEKSTDNQGHTIYSVSKEYCLAVEKRFHDLKKELSRQGSCQA